MDDGNDILTPTPPPYSDSLTVHDCKLTIEKFEDADLKNLANHIEKLLVEREAARKKAALDEIRALAKSHGLEVSVKAKRSRPSRARSSKNQKSEK